jgi:hypothetical protein
VIAPSRAADPKLIKESELWQDRPDVELAQREFPAPLSGGRYSTSTRSHPSALLQGCTMLLTSTVPKLRESPIGRLLNPR